MRILITTSQDIEYNHGDCLYAVIDVSYDLMQFILSKEGLFHKTNNSSDIKLHSLHFLENTPIYFRTLDDLSELFGKGLQEIYDYVQDGIIYRLKDGRLPDSDVRLVQDSTLVFTERYFYWTCFPEYTSLDIETDVISYDDMRQFC